MFKNLVIFLYFFLFKDLLSVKSFAEDQKIKKFNQKKITDYFFKLKKKEKINDSFSFKDFFLNLEDKKIN